MAVTMKKIAELAGVSIGTVDRALNGRNGVNPDVSKRILEIADSLGYKPNIMAKALAIKKKGLKIGVIFQVQLNPFLDSVMDGINAASKEIKDFGISVIVKYSKNFDPDDQLKLIDELISEGVCALALVPLKDEKIINRINELTAQGFPVALIVSNAEKVNNLVYVGCDANKVGRIAGGLIGLMSQGETNVLYVTPPLSMLGNIQRLEGFRSVLETRYQNVRLLDICELSNDDISAYKCMAEDLKKHSKIDTIMIANASLKGILEAIDEAGLLGNIKIITLDLAQNVVDGIKNKQITASIVQHPYKQGYKVVKLLFDYLVSGKVPTQTEAFVECDIRIYENLFD